MNSGQPLLLPCVLLYCTDLLRGSWQPPKQSGDSGADVRVLCSVTSAQSGDAQTDVRVLCSVTSAQSSDAQTEVRVLRSVTSALLPQLHICGPSCSPVWAPFSLRPPPSSSRGRGGQLGAQVTRKLSLQLHGGSFTCPRLRGGDTLVSGLPSGRAGDCQSVGKALTSGVGNRRVKRPLPGCWG